MTSALYDLHTHTTASDGRLHPRHLIQKAAQEDLQAIAITDHDTVDGIDEAREAAESLGVELITGVELSACYQDESIHVLGYLFRHREPFVVEFFAWAHQRRVERVQSIVKRLGEVGVPLETEEVFAKSSRGTVGRPHVAQVLIERGFVEDNQDAFQRYLGQGAPAYVECPEIDFQAAIDLIRRAGGVAVLAHPGLLRRDDLIARMVAEGLQGIEAYHCDHTPEDSARYLDLACRLGIIATGGSDFHSLEEENGSRLGCPEVTGASLEAIRRAAV